MRLLLTLLFLLFSTVTWAGSVNVNTATEAELEALPGIGPAKARAIMKYRADHGPFTSVDQLDDVPGIGPATLANLRPLVTVGDGKTVSTDAPTGDGTTPPTATAEAVNINTATEAELETLPGIGPAKAAAIVKDRSENGPYASCDDLARVNGIGPATVAAIKDRCTTE